MYEPIFETFGRKKIGGKGTMLEIIFGATLNADCLIADLI
jgi:hypothetical protein